MPFTPDAPAPSSAPSSGGGIDPVAGNLLQRGLNIKGIQLQDPNVQATFSGAQSGASTAASENAKYSADKGQLANFMKAMGDKPFSSFTEEELLKLPGATTEMIKNLQSIFKGENDKNSVEILAKLGEQLSALKDYSDKVPKSSGWMSRPRGVWEKTKQLVGEAPELQTYDDFKGSLATQTARKVSGEKGPLNEGDIKRAMSMLPNVPFESKEGYGMKWDLLNKLIEIQTGRKLPGLSDTGTQGLSPEEAAELADLEKKGY